MWFVISFWYLGDTLDGDGGADLAATARLRSEWIKFRLLFPFLTSRAPRLEMKGRVHVSSVISNMVYGSKTIYIYIYIYCMFRKKK